MNAKGARLHLSVLIMLLLVTLIMTYPLVLNLGSKARGLGDPLLNAWILSWDFEQLSNANVRGFFDANIFFPNHRTLAYSEHLFTQSLVAAVPLALGCNPILAHNLVTIFAFLSSAFGMYLLATYLTGSVPAGVVAGIVYGFSPFMFDHLSHVQVLTAGGIPLVFLFLARFFAHERWTDLGWLGLFTVLQMLANGYYAVYLCFFVGVTVGYHSLAAGRIRDRLYLVKLVVLGLGVAALTGPFIYQYIAFRHEMGFERAIGSYARWSSFLGTPRFNRLYGGFFPGQPEGRLFPGVTPVLLAVLALVGMVREARNDDAPEAGRFAAMKVPVSAVFNGVLLICAAVAAAVMMFDRLNLSTRSFAKPFGIIVLLLAVRAAMDPPFRRRWFPPLDTPRSWHVFYVCILVFAFSASFGTSINGPYQLLYDLVPGFKGIRAVTRIHIMTLASLAVLAAIGAARLASARRPWVRWASVVGVPLALLVEYASVPIPLVPVQPPEQLDPVCRWLAEQDAPVPILELPWVQKRGPKNRLEFGRVYASTIHWRPMVNGYSGFFPPVYVELKRRWREIGPEIVLEDARRLGVRQIVLQTRSFNSARLQHTRRALAGMVPAAVRVAEFDDSEVWQLAPAASSAATSSAGRSIQRSRWRASASIHAELAPLAIDGDLTTGWQGEPQRPDTSFTIDLGSVEVIDRVELALGDSRLDFPRHLVVEVSNGSSAWRTVAEERWEMPPIEAYLRPKSFAMTVAFEPTSVRYVRLTDRARHEKRYWSIHEITIRRPIG